MRDRFMEGMMVDSWAVLQRVRDLANRNAGFLTLLLFFLTLLMGWVSGVFSGLRRRPKLRIGVLPGPTFCCVVAAGTDVDHGTIHRTCLALYLVVTNAGSAPTTIDRVQATYRRSDGRNPFVWEDLGHDVVALADFTVKLGDSVKVYPFLHQINQLSPATPNPYLLEGCQTRGMVYFEGPLCWGDWRPRVDRRMCAIRVVITDARGGSHVRRLRVPVVDLSEARKFNPAFGCTNEAHSSSTAGPVEPIEDS